MRLQLRFLTAAAVVAVSVAAPKALALVSLEDGRDHLYVDATYEMGYDSNVFANAQSNGSFTYEGTLGLELARRAGWIGVNATASLNWARYGKFSGQDYVDPKVTAEFTKQTGRTTGSLTMSVQREDRTDLTINTRDTSWNYDAGLDLQYPVIERYSLTGTLDYGKSDYTDRQLFTDQTTYTGNLYLYYILNEQRDLFVNARERYTDESTGERDIDKALSGGVSGRVYGPFNGSVQLGYQKRTIHGGPDHGDTFTDLTASGSTTWNVNRRITLTGDLSRDYSTTALAQSIETTRTGLTLQDSFTSKASGTLSGAAGENSFLGVEGEIPPGDKHRKDEFVSLTGNYFYTINQHLKLSVNYTYYRSFSNLDFAEFTRNQLFFTATSHW
jgi:Putative beta-barrel porin 2